MVNDRCHGKGVILEIIVPIDVAGIILQTGGYVWDAEIEKYIMECTRA